MSSPLTLSHRLVLPQDVNHHQTLYAGSLLKYALEAAYVTASQTVGPSANLVLRRVLNIECRRPVPLGTTVTIQGMPLYAARAYLVIGLVGEPWKTSRSVEEEAWLEGLMGFAQTDREGRPAPLPEDLVLGDPQELEVSDSMQKAWARILKRWKKLQTIR
ncbi:Acyl-CoA hydrolase [Planctomycetales bacterium 10988]|nr:Acyl-CoA hydrolase [Planctomycetales bacterium 10988]